LDIRVRTSSGNGALRALTGPALRLQSDERLIELTRDGSSAAYGAIVERYRAPLLRYCRRLLGPGRAEDAVQQVFTNTLASLRSSGRQVTLRPWLYRAAHNQAVNDLARKGSDHEQLDPDFDGVPQPPERVEQSERLREVLGEVKSLPERQRSALVLRELEGRSYRQIATELDATPQVVRQLIHRARTRLRDTCGALLPMPALRWLALTAPGGGDRVADLAAGAGAGAGLAKAGLALLATGALVAGGVTGAERPGVDGAAGPAQAATAPGPGAQAGLSGLPGFAAAGAGESAGEEHGRSHGEHQGGEDGHRGGEDRGSDGPGDAGDGRGTYGGDQEERGPGGDAPGGREGDPSGGRDDGGERSGEDGSSGLGHAADEGPEPGRSGPGGGGADAPEPLGDPQIASSGEDSPDASTEPEPKP
jgi:RNA polymerase sigma factor (sigma-70 family)